MYAAGARNECRSFPPVSEVSDTSAVREPSSSGDPGSPYHACRVAIVVFVVAMVVAAIPIASAGRRVLSDTADEIGISRLRLASLAAAHADRGLTEAFYEIELMAITRPSESDVLAPESSEQNLRSVLGETTSFRSGVVVLGADGNARYWEPVDLGSDLGRSLPPNVQASAAASDDRVISEPFVDERTGDVVTALSLPVFASDGSRESTIIGLFDVGGPLITDLVAPALDLGASGHSDLVGSQGTIIAAINPAHGPRTGEHPGFYEQVARAHAPTVQTVIHEPSAESLDRSARHVMAYAPLRMAPWGVAIGASEAETMATVTRQRRTMIVFGASSIGVLISGLVLSMYACRKHRYPVGKTT